MEKRERSNIQYNDRASKGTLGLLAISNEAFIVRNGARLCDVPWRAWLGPSGVTHVRAGLIYKRDGVKSNESGVGEDGEKRWKDVEDVHCAFGKHEEHGKDGDDEIEIGDTRYCERGYSGL